MNKTFYSCLWFNNNAKDAVNFYCSVFEDSIIVTETPIVMSFKICGEKMMALNGGPMFSFNPSISFFIFCKTEDEINKIWKALSTDGKLLMPLNQYAWAKKYGWCTDKFGVNWQVMLDEELLHQQKIVPSLLFTNTVAGEAEQAIHLYTSLFNNSKILVINKYKANEEQPEGYIKYARFALNNKELSVMDNTDTQPHYFNEAISFVVECDTQKEIDYYWENLIANGGQESKCGWLKDKFGVSWQIVPTILSTLMSNAEKAPIVLQSFLQMKKFDIATLLEV